MAQCHIQRPKNWLSYTQYCITASIPRKSDLEALFFARIHRKLTEISLFLLFAYVLFHACTYVDAVKNKKIQPFVSGSVLRTYEVRLKLRSCSRITVSCFKTICQTNGNESTSLKYLSRKWPGTVSEDVNAIGRSLLCALSYGWIQKCMS